jgi:hypothetical protein
VNAKETAVLTAAIAKLDEMFAAETAVVQKARKATLAAALERRDAIFGLRRDLGALLRSE